MSKTKSKGNAEETLATLAERIRASHKDYLGAVRSSLGHARRAGELLLKAQERVPAGGWEKWVEDHCRFSKAMAERYMRVAKNYGKLKDLDPEELAGLSLRGALRLLSDKPASSRRAKSRPFTVPSRAEVKSLTLRARKVRLQDDSPEGQFIERKVTMLTREILALARRTRLTEDKGKPADPAQVAVALLERLREVLTVERVVTPRDSKPHGKVRALAG